MDARGFLESLVPKDETGSPLVHIEVIEAREPELEPFPPLPEVLAGRLLFLGIEGLYAHQRRALDLLDAGSNVIVATGTASGKT
ncbi:MAG: hypothetical protein H0W27_07010, partial [Actinobacteria bacterium]|nr:hypothetical protein [Actinomycetota bacterium]